MILVQIYYLPVLIEPVINLGLDIERISKVRWSGRSNPMHISISGQKIVCQFFVSSLGVLFTNSKVTSCLTYSKKLVSFMMSMSIILSLLHANFQKVESTVVQ